PSAPPAREDSKAESASKAPAAEAKSEDKSETAADAKSDAKTDAEASAGTNGRRSREKREDREDREAPEGRRSRGREDEDEEGMTRLYVNLGRRDGLRAGDIAKLLRESCELERADIGRIRVRDKHAFVDVLEERVDHVLSTLPGQKVDDREVVVEVAKGS
ncbi:MAG: hypothetical protein DRJ42_12540, partial [Deltaproteobacteria bacterium]